MKKKTKEIFTVIVFVLLLAVIMKLSGFFTISNIESGYYFESRQPIDGSTAIFGDYKLVQSYSTNSYNVECKAPTGDSYKEISRDRYNCAIYNSTKKAQSYTSCTGGTNCNHYSGIAMCSQCTAKGICPNTKYSCNGCSAEGNTCYGSMITQWDNCGCSVISQPTTNYISGGFKQGSSVAQSGFTYSLYYKNKLIANRTEFPMTNFYLPTNSIYLKEGKFTTGNDYETSLYLGTYGGTDGSYIIDITIKPSDEKLYATFDSKMNYTEGTTEKLPLTLINNYERPLKAKLTLDYSMNNFLGNTEKIETFIYDVPVGINNIEVPFVANTTESSISLKSSVEYYDSGYSGLAIKMKDFNKQEEFLSFDKNIQSNYRIVNSADWVRIKKLNFEEQKINILAKEIKPIIINTETTKTETIIKDNTDIIIKIGIVSIIIISVVIFLSIRKGKRK